MSFFNEVTLFDIKQLKQSEAKIQDLEKSQIEVTAIFKEERARRDVIEHDLRKMLRVSPLLPKQIYGTFNYLHAYSFHFGKRYRDLLIPSVR